LDFEPSSPRPPILYSKSSTLNPKPKILHPAHKALDDDDDGDDWEPLPGPAGSTVGGAYDPVDALHHVVGHQSAKERIHTVVNALEVNRRRVAAGGRAAPAPHMVLVGNPGCGKSMLARLVAYIVSECDVSRHGPLVRPSRTDLVAVGRSPGRTAEQVAAQTLNPKP
jgi:hypothetical protein